MDSSQILTITVFVIVITIVGTIALAVVGYLAFRLRDRKHPSGPDLDQSMGRPFFFERVRLPDAGDEADAPTEGDSTGVSPTGAGPSDADAERPTD